MTGVLLVDDHALFRKGVRALLATVEGLEIVGEAQSGPEAVRACGELRPDVILLDLQMPDGGGLEAIPGLRETVPDAAILVVTMRADDAAVREALLLGARGYVLKDSDGDDFLRAVISVARGDTVVGREVADRLAGLLRRQTQDLPFPELTERERAVLQLMARGRSNSEIAGDLFLSTKTVQNYVSRIFVKLGVTERPQAIVVAREAGLHRGECCCRGLGAEVYPAPPASTERLTAWITLDLPIRKPALQRRAVTARRSGSEIRRGGHRLTNAVSSTTESSSAMSTCRFGGITMKCPAAPG